MASQSRHRDMVQLDREINDVSYKEKKGTWRRFGQKLVKSWGVFNVTPISIWSLPKLCTVAFCYCTCAEFAGNPIFWPKGKSMSIRPGADLWSIKPPSMHSHCELIKIDIPALPIFFVLPLNVDDLSFKHPTFLCRYFWTTGPVGLMLGQGQYCTLAKSPSCERLSESYRKSFCLHH